MLGLHCVHTTQRQHSLESIMFVLGVNQHHHVKLETPAGHRAS